MNDVKLEKVQRILKDSICMKIDYVSASNRILNLFGNVKNPPLVVNATMGDGTEISTVLRIEEDCIVVRVPGLYKNRVKIVSQED